MSEPFDPRVTPWHLDESEFYEIESHDERMEMLLRYAVLAPSGHNTQPWSFRIVPEGVEVYADDSRRLPIADPLDRELLLSIGAAIMNLRVAAAHFGYQSTVSYGDDQPVAVVALRETCAPDERLAALFSAIPKRRTNRTAFEPREIEPAALERLCDYAEEQAELVRFVVPHDRSRAAELVAEADRLLMANEAWRAELAGWVRPNDGAPGDGMCGDAFGIPGPLAALAPWMVRSFDMGSARAKHDRELVEQAAGLIVITADDDRTSLLRAGEALEGLLLTLTSVGLQYAFVNQPLEVEALRGQMWSLLRSPKPPQLMIRIGYAPALPRPMPRRPVGEVRRKP